MTVSSLVARADAFRRSPMGVKLVRYTAGAVVRFGISEVVLVALFFPHLLGAKGSSIVASIAGIIPGYYLNRNWAWGKRGRSHLWREVVPYWVTAIGSTIITAVVIGVVNNADMSWPRDVRTIINAATYFVTYGVLFVVKFIIFNRWLFADRERPAQRPDQVLA